MTRPLDNRPGIEDSQNWRFDRKTGGPGPTVISVTAEFGWGDETVGFEVCDDAPNGEYSNGRFSRSVVDAAVSLYGWKP